MRFLLSVFRPVGYVHAQNITPLVMAEIDGLNEEMEAAGVRVFAGGLQPLASVKSVQWSPGSTLSFANGPAEEESRFLDGLWVLELESEAEAVAWGQKAAQACRATVEVRPFY